MALTIGLPHMTHYCPGESRHAGYWLGKSRRCYMQWTDTRDDLLSGVMLS